MHSTKDYWKKRIDNIKSQVKLRKLLDYYNISCQSNGEITQLHCPFHGDDAHPSARVYETNTMYCWVCNKTWDVVEFIKDLNNLNFKEAVVFLESSYGIQKPSLEESLREPSFEEFLIESNQDKILEKDYSSEFELLSKMLLRSKNNIDLQTYSRLFYTLDNIYAMYKTNKFNESAVLELNLKNLHSEISIIS
jgi:DNA primase